MKKEHQIIMLPSEKPSQILFDTVGGELVYNPPVPQEKTVNVKPQHLYILSNEERKEGDRFINLGSGGHPGVAIYKANSENSKAINEFKFPEIKKIIATTDTELTSKSVINTIDGDYHHTIMPTIPQHIIEAYVKKPFDKVMVECPKDWKVTDSRYPSPFQPKLNQDGTLAVSLVEEKMYTLKEMKHIFDVGRDSAFQEMHYDEAIKYRDREISKMD